MKMKHLKILFGLLVFMAMLTAGFFIAQKQRGQDDVASDHLLTGTSLTHPQALQPFLLVSNHQSMDEKALHGQWHVLFFGFTQCPGLCPMTLTRMDKVMHLLDEQGAPQPTLWFVSLDPAHDDSVISNRYAHTFNAHFVGLSGNQKTVDDLAHALNVAYGTVETSVAGKKQSTINHSGHLTVVNPEGQIVAFLTHPDHAEDVAQDLKTLMQRG